MPLSTRQKHNQTHELIDELKELHSEMLGLVNANLPALKEIHAENRISATNLLHYLALRRHDVRSLQERLAALGLSSLGRTEAHVLSAVRAVMNVLASLSGSMTGAPHADGCACG